MKEDIRTIPVNDIFSEKSGCPFCTMEKMLEEIQVNYIVGDAMMEPNIRIETNKKGFCHRHFSMMQNSGKKLPNALIMESHLQELIDSIPKGKKPDKKFLAKIKELTHSCYVCDRIDSNMDHLIQIIFSEWKKGSEFKELYKEQPFICLEHYGRVTEKATGALKGSVGAEFYQVTTSLFENYLRDLKEDTTYFCSMFDYRNQGKDWGKSIDVIERNIEFLTKEKPKTL
jgi:hypothetical protein